MTADEEGLTGLYFSGQKYCIKDNPEEKNMPVFNKTKQWLDIYFKGKEPDFMPELHLTGSPFQISVWELLQKIPYGKTTTYSEIALEIARQRNIKSMSAQAVGQAVGHNKISVIIPCHRVIGASGSLTGYAAGIDKKLQLMRIEKINTDNFL